MATGAHGWLPLVIVIYSNTHIQRVMTILVMTKPYFAYHLQQLSISAQIFWPLGYSSLQFGPQQVVINSDGAMSWYWLRWSACIYDVPSVLGQKLEVNAQQFTQRELIKQQSGSHDFAGHRRWKTQEATLYTDIVSIYNPMTSCEYQYYCLLCVYHSLWLPCDWHPAFACQPYNRRSNEQSFRIAKGQDKVK